MPGEMAVHDLSSTNCKGSIVQKLSVLALCYFIATIAAAASKIWQSKMGVVV